MKDRDVVLFGGLAVLGYLAYNYVKGSKAASSPTPSDTSTSLPGAIDTATKTVGDVINYFINPVTAAEKTATDLGNTIAKTTIDNANKAGGLIFSVVDTPQRLLANALAGNQPGVYDARTVSTPSASQLAQMQAHETTPGIPIGDSSYGGGVVAPGYTISKGVVVSATPTNKTATVSTGTHYNAQLDVTVNDKTGAIVRKGK